MQFYKDKKVLALAGGVGGARLANGLAQHLAADELTIVVNTGDDFDYWGLMICPDLDTVTYTLAGINNPKTGWGLAGETHNCLQQIKNFDLPSWFQLGDKDLATHISRSFLLKEGFTLTEATAVMAEKLGIRHTVLPMYDLPYRTIAVTETDDLDFQTYFVKERWQPVLKAIRWEYEGDKKINPALQQALDEADLIIFCPSNPFVSIDPILSFPAVLDAVQAKPSAAVSPIIGGEAVKGPAAKMFPELTGKPASALSVAAYYQERGLLNAFIMDEQDEDQRTAVEALGLKVHTADSLMRATAGQARLAKIVLEFCRDLV
jgi:LPPG:FO 2-phospho-L-lactate transferase